MLSSIPLCARATTYKIIWPVTVPLQLKIISWFVMVPQSHIYCSVFFLDYMPSSQHLVSKHYLDYNSLANAYLLVCYVP